MRSTFNKQNPMQFFDADGSKGAGNTEDALKELERKEKEGIKKSDEEIAEEQRLAEEEANKEAAKAEEAKAEELEKANAKAEETKSSLEEFKSRLTDPHASLEEMEKSLGLDENDQDKEADLDSEKKKLKEEAAKPATDAIVTIDDNYIKSQPEELRTILKGIEGDQVSPRALKNYTNAQLRLAEIKQKAEEKKEDISLEEMLKGEEIKEEKPAPKEKMITSLSQEEITAKRDDMALKAIQRKYPDFPDDGLKNNEARNEYYRDMMDERPAEYDDFKDYVNRANVDATTSVKNEVDLARNWKKLAGKSVDNALSSFADFLADKGLTDKDLEINLRDPKLIKSFLYDEQGNPNEDVVFYNHGVPMIATDQLVKTLKDQYYDKIIDVKANNARGDGFQKRKAFEPGPSISNAAEKGRSTVKDTTPSEITPGMSLEQMEKILESNLKEAEEQI